MFALPPAATNRPKSATKFFLFVVAVSGLFLLTPVLLFWLDAPPGPLWAISVTSLIMLANAFANWRWWESTSWPTTKAWAVLLLEALPATFISALIISPGDWWGYLWVLLVLFVGLLTANITMVVRRAGESAPPVNRVDVRERGRGALGQQQKTS